MPSRRDHGRSRSLQTGLRYRARRSPSASSSWSGRRRCSISRAGECTWRDVCFARVVSVWQRLPFASATNPRRRSTALSVVSWARRLGLGVRAKVVRKLAHRSPLSAGLSRHRLAAEFRLNRARSAMSVIAQSGPRGFALIERLFAALTDPARRERTAAALVLGYVAVWTLYGALAKASQDIHIDMSEQFVLARELAWGYGKPPPLAMAIVRAWFAVFPAADWSYYLLAMANAGLALWLAWRLSERFLNADKRVLGLALLTLIPFFNFHALKFNPNTILMPLWAGTSLFFLRSFETRRAIDAALAGVCAAAAMYGKYWSIVLLVGLAIAALADPRRAEYFRSRAPWITILVGAAAIAPHLIWLIANDFAPFAYAVLVHGEASGASALTGAAGYLLGSIAYICVPLLIVFAIARPTGEALADMVWPATAQRRLAAAAFWATLLLPAV